MSIILYHAAEVRKEVLEADGGAVNIHFALIERRKYREREFLERADSESKCLL